MDCDVEGMDPGWEESSKIPSEGGALLGILSVSRISINPAYDNKVLRLCI